MRQIFILEREELNDLKRGEPLKIVFGDQTITLQADVPRRSNGTKENFHKTHKGGVTITARVADYLEVHGGASVMEIAKALDVPRASVASPLMRGKGKIYKRSGHGNDTVWSTK